MCRGGAHGNAYKCPAVEIGAASRKSSVFVEIGDASRLSEQVGPNSIGFSTFISVIHPLARGPSRVPEGPRARG